jgi:uridylate kinase
MRIIFSTGGSILAPGLDQERFRKHAAILVTLAEEHDVGVAVGGGAVAREYLDAARGLGANGFSSLK